MGNWRTRGRDGKRGRNNSNRQDYDDSNQRVRFNVTEYMLSDILT